MNPAVTTTTIRLTAAKKVVFFLYVIGYLLKLGHLNVVHRFNSVAQELVQSGAFSILLYIHNTVCLPNERHNTSPYANQASKIVCMFLSLSFSMSHISKSSGLSANFQTSTSARSRSLGFRRVTAISLLRGLHQMISLSPLPKAP